jgi:hypothetical protein
MWPAFFPGSWTCQEPPAVTCPVDPCGRVVDLIRHCYKTTMCFGTDYTQQVPIQWYWTQPGALALGFATPFISRLYSYWENWPGLGEVQGAQRPVWSGLLPQAPAGTGQPCGDPAVWAGGWQGTIPPNYPRTDFGFLPCCGGYGGPAPLGLLGYSALQPYFPPTYFPTTYFPKGYFP